MIIINGIKTNQYAEPIIKQSINELDKLSFKLPNELIANANNEDAVIYKGHSYTIKEIDNNKIYCVYDVDELLEIYIESKILTALTIKDNMDKLLEGSGWTCEGDNSENRKAFTFNNTNIYDAVMEMAEKYDYEVRFDNVLKKVYFAAELGSDKGAYAAEGLNLSAFNVNRSTYGYATRIEPRGQDGMTIAEVNGGVTYLENKSVTDKTITFYWEDNRYTIKENLKEAAEKKLKELAEIKTTYEINITDLAALSDKYSILEYGLGDTIRVIGKEVKQRIVALERHDYDPTKNKCTLASAAVRLSSTTDDIRKEILTNYEITSTNLWLLDDEIKSRVKTEKYEQDQKELGSTLTTMQSDIVQNAEAITSRVSKTEILTDPEIQEALKGDKGDKGDPGARGATGEQGPRGAVGTSVTGIVEYYGLSTNENTQPTSWTEITGSGTPLPKMTATNKYLWNYEKINFSDITSQDTIPVIVGVYGDKGDIGPNGQPGIDGRSISSIQDKYQVNNLASGVTRTTGTWINTPGVTTDTNKYLWNYEIINWNKAPTPTYVEPIIIGVHGEKGDEGLRGPQGSDGQDSTIYIAYADSADGTENFSLIPGNRKYMGVYSGIDRQSLVDKVNASVVTGDGRNLLNHDGSPIIIWGNNNTTFIAKDFLTFLTFRDFCEVDDFLTASCDIEIEGEMGIDTKLTLITGPNKYRGLTSITNFEPFQHIVGTIRVDDSSMLDNNRVYIRLDNLPTTTKITASNLKLEKGKEETPYSKPPEIQLSELDSLLSTPSTYQWSLIKGSDGKDGADGQSVSAVTEQWYNSTSNEELTGGQWWDDNIPGWGVGRFYWKRLKVVYINPSKTEYTEPILDTVNTALGDVYNSGIILPSQKSAFVIKLSEMTEEHTILELSDGLPEYTAYNLAYNDLRALLDGITANMESSSDIRIGEFKTLNDTYEAAHNALRQAVNRLSTDSLIDLESRVTSAEQKITDESIVNTVTSSSEYIQGVLDKLTTLEQTDESFQASISQNLKKIGEIESSKIMSYFNFQMDSQGNGYTELGSNLDGMKLRQYRDRISFMNGELEQAYFANKAMVVDEVRTKLLAIGENYEIKEINETTIEGWYHGG